MPVVTYYGHCNRSAQDVAYCTKSDWNYYASSFSGNIASVFCFYHLLLTKFLDNKNKKKKNDFSRVLCTFLARSTKVPRWRNLLRVYLSIKNSLLYYSSIVDEIGKGNVIKELNRIKK